MNRSIFTISDIISIVMKIVENIEGYDLYNLDYEEQLNFPKLIRDKLESLNSIDYEDFMSKISHIAQEILPLKNGELNELNYCHQEITFLAKDILEMYIKKD